MVNAMKTKKQKNPRLIFKKQNIIQAILVFFIIIVLNILATYLYFRFDLTKEKRFTISNVSKDILDSLNDDIIIEVYFEDSDLPVDLLRYQKVVSEFIKNFSSFSKKIDLEFKKVYDKDNEKITNNLLRQLYTKGLDPTYINESSSTESKEKIIFAGALVKYREREYPVNLIKKNMLKADNSGFLSESELEKEFIHAIWMLTREKIQKIAFLIDHGELDENQSYDIINSLSSYYTVDRLKMNNSLTALNDYAAIILAKPTKYIPEKDKYIIDQYIMKGGKVIFLTEWLNFSMDSLSHKVSNVTTVNDINLADQLFNYGVRINPDLIQDLKCLQIPVFVNTIDGQPQFEAKPWYYFPVILSDTSSTNPIVRNLEPMRTHFVSSIDLVGENSKIKKTVLLHSSQNTKITNHPVDVSLNILKQSPDKNTFQKSNIPIAVLLEGEFTSNFRNRLNQELVNNENFKIIEKSSPNAKIIVISDGDFIRNEYIVKGEKIQHLKLGMDKYYGSKQETLGNTQFIINCVNYLCEDGRFISLRMRDIKMRLLDTTKISQERAIWTVFCAVIPIMIILILGTVIILLRYLKYKR